MMKAAFDRFLKRKGVYDAYYKYFELDHVARTNWHTGRPFDFFDKANRARFVSGAFRWSEAKAEGISWQTISNDWKHYIIFPEMPKNSRTL